MQKTKLLFLLVLMSASLTFGQSDVQNLVNEGIQYHDQGDYDKAIEFYKKALKIEPLSTLLYYEISFSYFNKHDYENAIKYSSKVIDLDGEHLLSAYIVNGSSLDMLGKTKESIKLFKKAIKKFDNYLLNYNLAINYSKIKDYKNAKKSVIDAINLNSNHASSHLILGYIENDTDNKIPSLISLYYFLFLEPDSERAKEAYTLLTENFTGNVSADSEKENTINIMLSPDSMDSEFGTVEMMISFMTAANMSEENKDKTDGELFIENTKSFFSMLGELNDDKKNGITWDFYIPFFYDLAKSEHISTYCYYISQVRSDDAVKWLGDNPDKLDQFAIWLENN